MNIYIRNVSIVLASLFFVSAYVIVASGSKGDTPTKHAKAKEVKQIEKIEKIEEKIVAKKFGKVIEITSAKDLLSMLADNAIVLVKFHAPWCGFCHKIEPFFVDVASKFGDVLFVSVNIDDFGQSQELQKIVRDVSGLPTIKLYKNGSFVEAIVGGTTKEKIAELVHKGLAHKHSK
jgi:thioredoxin 1